MRNGEKMYSEFEWRTLMDKTDNLGGKNELECQILTCKLPLVLELRTAQFLRDNRTSTEHTVTVYNSMLKNSS